MKEKVRDLLIKCGNNEASVDEMIEKNFFFAVKTYPEASARFIADVVSSLR